MVGERRALVGYRQPAPLRAARRARALGVNPRAAAEETLRLWVSGGRGQKGHADQSNERG